jgi:predicted peptidase
LVVILLSQISADQDSSHESKLVSADGNVQQRIGEIFTELEHYYTGGRYDNELFRYRLFIPEAARNGSEKFPVLVWLHGHGENGRDNLIHLRWFDRILQRVEDLSQYRFFILAVQYPPELPVWFREHGDPVPGVTSDDMCELVVEILRDLMETHPMDRDRIYLAGVSNGAAGCWETAMRYPELFAAVVPMASADIDESRLEKITEIPLWVFNNSDDPISPLQPIQAAVDELKQLGGIVHLTVGEGAKHDCWTTAFCDYDVMSWMLSNRRGSPQPPSESSKNPRKGHLRQFYESWGAENLIIQVAVIALILWAGARLWRRAG